MKKKRSSRPPRPSRIVGLFKRIFRVRFWLDLDRIQDFFLYMVDAARRLFVLSEPIPKEKVNIAFQKVLKDYQVTDEALKKQRNALLWWSRILCVVSIGGMGLAIYYGLGGHAKATLLTCLVSSIGFVLAFRYHYWSYQIQSRQLGCSFSEWFRSGLLGGKKT